jgi:hypothetical protein
MTMVDISTYPTANYVEIVKQLSGQEEFMKLYGGYAKKQVGLNKSFSRYSFKNMVYEHNLDKKEVKVYSITPLGEIGNILYYRQHKVPYYLFPSHNSKEMGIHYVNRITFRLCGSVFVNFESSIEKCSGKITNRLFINYNHDPKQDVLIANKFISNTTCDW